MTRALSIGFTILFAGSLRLASGDTAGQQAAGAPGELSEREAAIHVLDRLSYGARPGDIERVMRMGVDAYIAAQLEPERVTENPELERRLAAYETLTMTTAQLLEKYPPPARVRARMRRMRTEPDTAALREAARRSYRPLAELSQARLLRAVYSERQLQEVMVDFWYNHFNVFARKGPARLFLTEYERDVIRPHALGKFRDLLGAVARSPAMLVYLDNWLSAAPEGAPRAGAPPRGRRARGPGRRRARGLNENYARELLELHTLGVDGGYTQHDVVEVARAFTGWTIDLRTGEFVFRPDLHDAGKKVVLGQEIAGGGKSDGEQVLDLLARHPSTARFVAEKLARRFVADDPPPALVERAAATFTATDGDIREVVRTIVTSPEFFSRAAYRAKVKTPLEWLVSSVRALGVDVREPRLLVRALARLDQPLYGAEPPTGYPDAADAWASAGALLARAEMGERLARLALRGLKATPAPRDGDPVPALLDRIVPGGPSDGLRTAVERATGEERNPRRRAERAIALALASPDFQRR